MKFSELLVGTIFKFNFDRDANWWYVKTGSDRVVCIQAPEINQSAIGKDYEIKDECYIANVRIGSIVLKAEQ